MLLFFIELWKKKVFFTKLDYLKHIYGRRLTRPLF